MAAVKRVQSNTKLSRLNRPWLKSGSPAPAFQRPALKLLLAIIGVMGPVAGISQELTVRLLDKTNGMPVSFAYVSVSPLSAGGNRIVLSDTSGFVHFTIPVPALLSVTCMGYRQMIDTLYSGGLHQIWLSPDFYQIDQVVVTGQFRAQPVDKSVYRIDVIDSRQIRLKAANHLGDLLKTELGYQYRSEGALGDFVRIRGLSGEYVKILVDGIPVTGRVAGRIDLGQITLQDVDHIEIIEGPMSVVYGSNALAGAINIITADHSDKRMHAFAESYYESVGSFNVSAIASARSNNHTLSAQVARNFFGGWGPEDTSRYQTWKPKRQYQSSVHYKFKKSGFVVNAQSDFLHEELRDHGPLVSDYLYEKALDGYHFTKRSNSRINLTRQFSDDFTLNLQAGYSYYQKEKQTWLNDLVHLEKVLAENANLHDTTRFSMLTTRGFVSNIPGKKFEYQSGFDFSYESARGKRTDGFRELSDLAGFINFIFRPINHVSLQPGIRVMYNSNYKAPLVYGINVKYNPTYFSFQASWAKGFHAPSLKQLYLNFIDSNHEILGNPDLKAETARNLSLSAGFSRTFIRHHLQVELQSFHNSIDNAIQLALSTARPGWGKYFNLTGDPFRTQGAGIKLNYRYATLVNLGFGLMATGRYRIQSGHVFDYSTDYMATASFSSRKMYVQLALFYKYTDDYLEFTGNYTADGEPQGIAQQYLDGYHTLDMTLTKDFFRNKFSASAGFKNLLDVRMVNAFGTLGIHGSSGDSVAAGYGRTFFVKLGYRFTKI